MFVSKRTEISLNDIIQIYNFLNNKKKGVEIAEITGHSEFDIGRAVGILKQGNLVRV